jgi:hypothetical protein
VIFLQTETNRGKSIEKTKDPMKDVYLSFSKTEYPHVIEERTRTQLEKLFSQNDPNFFETVHYKNGKLFRLKLGASGIKDPEPDELGEYILDESYKFYDEIKKYLKKKSMPLF